MKTYATMINDEFDKMLKRKWSYIYFAVDLHGVVFKNNYNGLATEVYDDALEALKIIGNHSNVKIILWTSSTQEDIAIYRSFLEDNGIAIFDVNRNKDVTTTNNSAVGTFDSKFYFNILLDDKAGFEPENDWKALICHFKQLS